MKTNFPYIFTSVLVIFIHVLTAGAQDNSQLNLPEGAKFRFGKGWIEDLAYSPDGERLAVAGSIGVWLYDAKTGEELNLIAGHTSAVNSVAFSSRWTYVCYRKLRSYRPSMGYLYRRTHPNPLRTYVRSRECCIQSEWTDNRKWKLG